MATSAPSSSSRSAPAVATSVSQLEQQIGAEEAWSPLSEESDATAWSPLSEESDSSEKTLHQDQLKKQKKRQ